MKLFQVLRANEQHGLGELQDSEYINCLENCNRKTVLSVSLSRWIDVVYVLLPDSVMDLIQFNIFIKDLGEIGSMFSFTVFHSQMKPKTKIVLKFKIILTNWRCSSKKTVAIQ